jgi:hypothetical protein
MADLHEALIRSFRKKVIRRGLRETKSPMVDFRPDIFAEKVSREGTIIEQIAVEAEIHSTLFNEHTSHPLLTLGEYLRLQKRRRIKARGFLLVPRIKSTRNQARSLLDSLFPEGTVIRVVDAA